MIEKLAALARVALLQSTQIWVGELGASVICTNDRIRGSNIYEGSCCTGTMSTDDEAMTASGMINIARTWCN